MGKEKFKYLWNAGGIRQRACDVLQQIAEAAGSRAPVWRGSSLPIAEQGIKVLRTPLGHEDFVAAHLRTVLHSHQTLLERIRRPGCSMRMGFVAPQRRCTRELPVTGVGLRAGS